MFREMRRAAQQLTEAEARAILEGGSFGVLACLGDEDWPYAVPLSYAVEGEHIYIHCATQGQKLDAVRREPRVSFCVVGQDAPQSGKYTTHYRSAIAFGRARLVEGDGEKLEALMCIGRKYEPGRDARTRAYAGESLGKVAIIDIRIEHLSGKQARGLLRKE